MRLMKHRVFLLSIGVATFLGVLSCSSGSSVVAPKPAYFDPAMTLDAALAQADREDKVVFAVASGDTWCPPCQRYKRGALSDGRIAQWIAANAVPVYIDVDPQTGHPDASRLGVRGVPTTVVLRDGEVVARDTGALSAEDLLQLLASAGS